MSEPRFEITRGKPSVAFTLNYDLDSFSIGPHPFAPPHDSTTIQVKFVALYLDDDGDVVFPVGYLALEDSRTGDPPPHAPAGSLRVIDANAIRDRGVTVGVGEYAEWSVALTADSSWVVLQRAVPRGSTLRYVRFAEPCIAGLADESLVSLWLRVENLMTVARVHKA